MKKEKPRIIFLFTSPRDSIINKMKKGECPDTALHGMNYIEGAEHLIVYPKSFKSLLLIPKLLKYDFIITQDNLFLGYIVSVLSKIFRIKTYWLYLAINSSTIICRHVNNSLHLFLLKTIWKSYTKIICISNEQMMDFQGLGIPSKKLIFIPFGVDNAFFKPNDFSNEGDFILSVGRDMGRDYEILLRAADKLPFKFVIVAAPKNIPKGIEIPANVSVLYNIDISEVRDLYRKARLVAIVSKDQSIPAGSDCSGQTVILDALSAGKAVIATDRSWISDYFSLGSDLIVVKPNSPEMIAKAINDLWHNNLKRKEIALSGYNKVNSEYSTKIFSESILRLINSI